MPVSASADSFMPFHLTGPHAGKTACPLCIYGLGPQLQLWVEESKLGMVAGLVQKAEQRALRSPKDPKDKRDGFTPYLVVAAANGKALSRVSENLVKSWGLKRLFVTVVPSWDDPQTSGLYGHSMKDRPGSRAYLVINRRVFQRWEKPSEEQWPAIARSLEEGRRFVTTYDLVDRQIAPAWEPGQRLIVKFRVVDKQARPLANQKVNAYQTDRSGLYNPRGWNRRAPTLATTAWTDSNGWIRFDTIMPGPYPNMPDPAHIHFSTVVNGKPEFRTLVFEGDPRLTPEQRAIAGRNDETKAVFIDKKSKLWEVVHTFVVK